MTIRRTVYASPVDALAALVRSLVVYEQRHKRNLPMGYKIMSESENHVVFTPQSSCGSSSVRRHL
jgi:hypothetical protein